jgi:hypothetical protein
MSQISPDTLGYIICLHNTINPKYWIINWDHKFEDLYDSYEKAEIECIKILINKIKEYRYINLDQNPISYNNHENTLFLSQSFYDQIPH